METGQMKKGNKNIIQMARNLGKMEKTISNGSENSHWEIYTKNIHLKCLYGNDFE